MGSKSNYLENKILDHVLRGGTAGTSMSQPAAVYLGLFTVLPDSTTESGGTEVSTSSTGYSRQAITFAAASSGSISSNAAVTFSQATASWGTIVGWGVFDASTSGNLLYYGSISPTKTVSSSDTASVAAGQVVITED